MPHAYLPHHDPDVETLVRPRYLAGPGDREAVDAVFEPLRGWRVVALGPYLTEVVATSPCHRVRVGYRPDREQSWQVTAALDPFAVPTWRGGFSRATPPEIVGAFLGALSDSLQYDAVSDTTGTFVSLEGTLADANEAHSEAGWPTVCADGRWLTTSDDGEVEYEVGPLVDPAVEMASDVQSGFTWRVASGDPDVGWTAGFSSCTPLHLIAAVNGAVADSSPLVRTSDDLPQRVVVRALAEQAEVDRREAEARAALPTAAELLADGNGLETPVAVNPLYLAGPGQVERAVAALTSEAGWRSATFRSGQLWESDCRTVRVAHLPERTRDAWQITALAGPLGMPTWKANFSYKTPAEVLGEVTRLVAETVTGDARLADSEYVSPFELDRHGWTSRTASVWTTFSAPDPKVVLQHNSAEFGRYEELEGQAPPSWTLTAGIDDWFCAWSADFTSSTPSYLVTAAALTAVDPAPVLRTRRSLPEMHLPYLQVVAASTGRSSAARSGTAPASRGPSPDPAGPQLPTVADRGRLR
ncbi:DUF317 domain-containing protein [Kitasatospora griseola]|uniref:DUF317 domain-containing protein n=1 Tax=Kitasatospora griseola TaxID=2064 RepID=UPI00167127F1|nr:DUF317 domain-containing protein [Kitasatospora griseola]GGR03578.1 hypothetical protein GCM10010195_69010 [Kitasatospora griseola]